jgi:phospholipase C
MGRTPFLCLSVLLLSASALLLNLNGCGGSNSRGAISPGKIQHVVVIFQENRTPDNLFHGLPNADIANSGVNSLGQTIPLQPITLANRYDLSHQHSAFVRMYDNGKMDGADKVPACTPPTPGCPPNPQFQYVNPSEVAPYFQLAEQYTFGDRMFQTNQGPSFPAHQFIISGTSAPTATSNLFAAENTNGGTGCTAPLTAWVWMIDPSGIESSKMYPCFEHPTLLDLLDAKSITWRYYTPSPGSIWTGPNAIRHLRLGPDWSNNVILQNTQILTDISNKQLPTVSWVIPTGQASDHPGSNNGNGPSWVASIVNAIGGSSYWANTAIIITWDDWGGWYDHVPPPKVIHDGTSWGSGYVYGFRVPLIVVSPYAKAGYISHVTHDFGSILSFIEKTYNLPSLEYADARADDLSDCFNFNQSPLQFQTIAAPLSAEHFVNDRTPPTDPDDD